jgi:hypothetical protein
MEISEKNQVIEYLEETLSKGNEKSTFWEKKLVD